VLATQLMRRQGYCLGFVVMPDHVHALVRFDKPEQTSPFMQQWKRLTSYQLKRNLQASAASYFKEAYFNDPVWRHRYYCFVVADEKVARQKLKYMHQNPVRAGLVDRPEEWAYSSARHYLCGQEVGVKIEWPG